MIRLSATTLIAVGLWLGSVAGASWANTARARHDHRHRHRDGRRGVLLRVIGHATLAAIASVGAAGLAIGYVLGLVVVEGR